MIDIALKHFIYELCIDQIFDGITRNFINVKCANPDIMLKVGERYDIIIVVQNKEKRVTVFRNVLVEGVSINLVSLWAESISYRYGDHIESVNHPPIASIVKAKDITHVGKPIREPIRGMLPPGIVVDDEWEPITGPDVGRLYD